MKLLDLFCGAGGAAMGYHRAGFEVVGVDVKPQRNYPFPLIQADAIEFLEEFIENDLLDQIGGTGGPEDDGYWAWEFDAIHASPPCQAFTSARSIRNREHPDLLTPIKDLLKKSNRPWVIENVPGAPMCADYTLCGTRFDLGIPSRGYLSRHRIFELGGVDVPLLDYPCAHPSNLRSVGVYGHTGSKATGNTSGNHGWSKADWEQAMGIDWMSRNELAQAIPPAYTEFIGKQLRAAIEVAA